MAKLTTRKRKKLPKSAFALPERAPGPGSFPIDTANRARNALARVAQHGTPAEVKKVKAAVRRRYPSIAVGGEKSK